MDTTVRAYLLLLILFTAVSVGLIRLAVTRGSDVDRWRARAGEADRRADRWKARAHLADQRADGWRDAYERTRMDLLQMHGVPHEDALIDLALSDDAYSLYRHLERSDEPQ